jgi:hypothetical protein
MFIEIVAQDYQALANAFELTNVTLTKHSILDAFGLACTNAHMQEISGSVTTNGRLCVLQYLCAFGMPSTAVEWLNDNNYAKGKYINWSENAVKMGLHLTAIDEEDLTIVFVFNGYEIKRVNGVSTNSPQISWKPRSSNGVLTIEAVRAR